MTRYLLDTNHVSEIFKRQPGILARIRPSPQAEFGIPLPAIGELWFMVCNSARIAQNAADMERVLRPLRLTRTTSVPPESLDG